MRLAAARLLAGPAAAGGGVCHPAPAGGEAGRRPGDPHAVDRSQRLRTRGPGAAVRGGGALRGRHPRAAPGAELRSRRARGARPHRRDLPEAGQAGRRRRARPRSRWSWARPSTAWWPTPTCATAAGITRARWPRCAGRRPPPGWASPTPATPTARSAPTWSWPTPSWRAWTSRGRAPRCARWPTACRDPRWPGCGCARWPGRWAPPASASAGCARRWRSSPTTSRPC